MTTARLPAPPQRTLIDWMVFATGAASLVVALALTLTMPSTSVAEAPSAATAHL